MKVQTIKIKNFKALTDVEAEINGNNILLVGENGVGKSSFIQAIQIALGSSNIPPNVNGEWEVVMDKTGDKYKFKVKVRDGKSVVEITDPEGRRDNKKGTLAQLVGAIEFDIDEFVELSKSTAGRKKQIEIFKGFLSSEVRDQLEKFEADNLIKFNERTDINRQIKTLEAEINGHPLRNIMDLTQFKQVDVTTVYDELKRAKTYNDEISGVKQRMGKRLEEIETKNKEILEMQLKLDRLKNEVKQAEELNNDAIEWLNVTKEIDLTEMEATIKGAGEANEKYNQAQALIKKRAQLFEAEEEASQLTVLIETGRQSIADAIRDMEGPVDGLSFDDDQLVYNGIPVNPDSLSTSEIMELGIRLKMAENPDLGILFIQRGESLGAKRLKEIQEIAKNAGWQLIMEQVERGKEKLCIELMEG